MVSDRNGTTKSTGTRSPRVAAALLIAGAALLALGASAARAQTVPPAAPCNDVSPAGTIVTCSGNLSTGVALNNGTGPVTTLNVGNLTTNIAPAPGVVGVYFGSNMPVNLNVDTGPFAIITNGLGAEGILAGAFGASSVSVTASGSIQTSGDFAEGILAGAIAGNASISSFASITTAGMGAAGIRGSSFTGDVDIFSAGNISTTGEESHGIYASTGDNIAIASYGNISVGGADAAGIFAESDTGEIFIDYAGDISTAGEDGAGIFAETGGIALIYSNGNIRTRGDGAAGIIASGQNGVVVVSAGNITTSGDEAPGIAVIAQGAAVAVSSGNITTTGNTSDGISVQSLGGMAVAVSTGTISATGTGSAGIYAAGETGALVMNSGSITGGACCAGVMMDSASFNQLLNWGTITAGLSDYAIDLMAPTSTVDNFGTVTGDVRLFDLPGGYESPPAAVGTFINHAGALFNSGDEVMASLLVNDGTIAPGGRGAVRATQIDQGEFIQSAGGVYAVDIDGAGARSDRINVGETAELAGRVAVNLTSVPLTPLQSYVILSADGGTTDEGLSLIASPVLHATLLFPNANDVVLGIAVDFAVDQLNPNQRAIAIDLNRILSAGVGTLGPAMLGLLNSADLDEVKSGLNQLSPEIYSDAQIAALYSSLAFNSSLLSCKVNGNDTASIMREGQCLWAGANARFLDSGTTSDQIGFNETAGLFTAGAQVALDDVWRLGVGGAYQTSTLETATNAQSEGSLGQGGVSLKYNPGPLLLAGAVTGGGAHYDTRRPMAFGGFTGLAEGDQDLGIISGALRAAYVLGSPSLYFKPIIDASLTHLQLGGFTESGGNGAALSVEGNGQTVFSLAPVVEAGTEWWLGNGTLVRPMIRAGAVWYDNADFALTAGFAGAPLGVSPFTIRTDIDDVMGLVGAGIEVISQDNAVLRISYDGQLGSSTQIHSVGIKGSARF